jgi:clan AA aspartic protease (TIGR02281 family)
VNTCEAAIFSWKDKSGVTHFTDSAEKIPFKYRDGKMEGLRIIEEVPSEKSFSSNPKINPPITRLNHLQEYKVPLISTNSGNFIVNATINGKVKVKLMLDTGASLMSLSPEVCRKLGIEKTSNLPVIQLQTANGISRNNLIALDKVKIGDAEASLVETSIGKKILGIEGLLGMSFLSNFQMEINHTESELILKPLAKPGERVWGGKPAFWWKSKFRYYNSQINGYKFKAMHTKTRGDEKREAVTKVVRFYEDLHKKLTRRALFYGLPKI